MSLSIHEASEAKKRFSADFFSNPNVVGIGTCLLDRSRPEAGWAVLAYLRVPEGKSGESIPDFVDATREGRGYRAAVLKSVIGTVTANGVIPARQADPEYGSRRRPAFSGYSVGTQHGTGSIALKFYLTIESGLSNCVASNNHVLTDNNTDNIIPIMQPGPVDGGTEADNVGRLRRRIPLVADNWNVMDLAVMRLSGGPQDESISYGYGLGGKHIVDFRDDGYDAGNYLLKAGRTTGFVTGHVETSESDMKVDYKGFGGLDEIPFTKIITVRADAGPISLPGDSGSLWMDAIPGRAVAINFSGSGDGLLSCAFPTRRIKDIWPDAGGTRRVNRETDSWRDVPDDILDRIRRSVSTVS